MPTDSAIDDALLIEAQRIGKHATRRETVEAALRECVLRRRRVALAGLEPHHHGGRAIVLVASSRTGAEPRR